VKPSERNKADRKLIKAAVAKADAETAEIFTEWLVKLEAERKETLSDKQRTWAESIAGTETYENLWSAGKVPRGREVPTPAVLLHRPLRPPGRS
jgi:hypothetical protein